MPLIPWCHIREEPCLAGCEDNCPLDPANPELNMESVQMAHARRVLDLFGGRREEAAAALGISPSTLWRWFGKSPKWVPPRVPRKRNPDGSFSTEK